MLSTHGSCASTLRVFRRIDNTTSLEASGRSQIRLAKHSSATVDIVGILGRNASTKSSWQHKSLYLIICSQAAEMSPHVFEYMKQGP